ncbi:MAG: UMP kinase [Candidatus Pacebacteria bacterium]|nr:UMP kinase [Candidatus Paceibacterota bacterium]
MKQKLKYKRVILKFSGEVFGEENGKGVSIASYLNIAKKIAKIKKENKIDLAIVIGGGNIFRGRENEEKKFNKAVADNMGMLGTVINGLGLEEALENIGIPARTMTAIKMDSIAEPFVLKKALKHFKKDRVIIFAGGTGNPFFTTDSAAALRACEISADLILKATNVDGVYDKDPQENKDAKMYKKISYKEALEKKLNVMDSTAFALCWDQSKPIIVFNIDKINNISKAFKEEEFGTLVF